MWCRSFTAGTGCQRARHAINESICKNSVSIGSPNAHISSMIVSMTPDERPANGTWIDCPDPDRWTRTALDGHYSFPVLPNGYIVKSGRSPLNECAAYQLANFLGVPVPDHFFFILSKDAIIQRPTQRGTVCIALDRQPVTRDSMNPKTIIKYSKNIAATHLAFSCFDRQCEWPTVILNPNKATSNNLTCNRLCNIHNHALQDWARTGRVV
jgi:hypothetical protein